MELNGQMDWMQWNWDDELKKYVTEITEPVDCIVLGRKLAQGFIPHWASNPEAEGADKFNSTKKVVFTKTLDKSEWENTVLAKGDLVDEITNLKEQDGKDMIVFASSKVVQSFTNAGLIDEYRVVVHPVILGSGKRLLDKITARHDLKLESAKPYKSGAVLLRYVVATQ